MLLARFCLLEMVVIISTYIMETFLYLEQVDI